MKDCYKCKGTGKMTLTVVEAEAGKTEKMDITCIYCQGVGKLTAKEEAHNRELDDAWCRCASPGDPVPYNFPDGTHGYDCSKCGKILQTG